jgi:hypothetical protein
VRVATIVILANVAIAFAYLADATAELGALIRLSPTRTRLFMSFATVAAASLIVAAHRSLC